MSGNFFAILNFNRLFLKLNWFICNYLPVLPDHSFRPWTINQLIQLLVKYNKYDI